MVQPILNTDRLILRPFQNQDAEAIFQYASNPAVAQFTTWTPHQSIDDSIQYLNWIGKMTCSEDEKLFFVWAIQEKISNQVIGSIDFKNLNPTTGQFDYALAQDHWNKGYMTEAAKTVFNWAFEALPNLFYFQSLCMAENIGSRKVMEKVGLKLTEIRPKSFNIKGQLVDMAYYSTTRPNKPLEY